MLQTTLGRLDSSIVAPPGTLDLYVFVDAGGRQAECRVWGGLAAIGTQELMWIESAVCDLKRRYANRTEVSGELKGKVVSTRDAMREGRTLDLKGRRIRFWVNWYPRASESSLARLRQEFQDFLAGLHPHGHRLDQDRVERWSRDMEKYFRKLKPVNRHKVLSLLAHIQWLAGDIRRTGIGSQLGSAKIIVDREDFPKPAGCANLVKAFVSASLQAAGMSYRLTGSAAREEPEEGAVTVDVHSDSAAHAGLQYCDVLLQAVQQQLPRPKRLSGRGDS
jgi:hypothetical protein